MSALVLLLIFAIVCNVALSLECPTSCPRVVTSTGVSNCCSIGDKATGCGVCEYTTCSENNFANCVENYGIVCSASTAGCSVKSVGDVTAGQNRLGVIVGGACPSMGSIVMCSEGAGDCVPADNSYICGHYPFTVDLAN